MLNVENVEQNRVKLTITVSNEDFKNAMDKAFEIEKGKVNIPGFRKGSISRKMFEKKFGVGSLFNEAINYSINNSYPKAVVESKLEVVSQPEIDFDVKNVSEDNDFVYTALVWIKPEVKLGLYKGIKVEKQSNEVTEKEIDKEVELALESKAELEVKKSGKLADTNLAIMDYEGFVNDVPFEGGKAENAELVIGSGQFIPGFEEGMIGMTVGETRDVMVTFPEEYHAEDLKGKEAKFVVTLHEIKVKKTPELTDELVVELDKELKTVAEFREKIKTNLSKNKETQSKNFVIDTLVETAVANAEFSVPVSMIEEEIEEMVARTSDRAKQYGLDLATFLSFSGVTEEAYRETIKPQAETSVRQKLVLEAIAKAENIVPTDEKINSVYEDLSKQYNLSLKEVEQRLPRFALSAQLTPQLVVEFLEKNAEIK